MKNANQCAKKLKALIKKHAPAEPPDFPDHDDTVAMLVQSFLIWEATTARALTAYQRIRESVVDFNDMRVSMPFEIVEIIGARYPHAQDRCERMRATLRDVFLREHVVNLDGLKDSGKRDIKKYIESLDGILPFIASRVQLICFGVHGIPVDEQLRTRLIEEGAAESGADVTELTAWLSRQIKAEDSLTAHYAFQAMMDTSSDKSARSSSRAGDGKKKTTRKKSTSSDTSKSSSKKTAANAAN